MFQLQVLIQTSLGAIILSAGLNRALVVTVDEGGSAAMAFLFVL